MPRGEAEKLAWLKNFANKLGTYATKYNITAAEVTDTQNVANQNGEYNKKLTQYKVELREGVPSGASASVTPASPAFGAVPTVVAPGIFVRAVSLANIIKKRTNYTLADGEDLGIEGEEISNNSVATEAEAKPAISVRLIQGGKPEIVWTKGKFDGIDVYVDRGNGQFAFLATDNFPNYIDNTPPPNNGAAVWKYKAIYKYGDETVGSFSDIVSVAVSA